MLITYLPLPTFKESARVLETKDLRYSIESGLSLIEYSFTTQSKTDDFPTWRMWKDYPGCLQLYIKTFISELKNRGEEVGKLESITKNYNMSLDKLPWWFFEDMKEKEKIMRSHREHLIRINDKYPETWHQVKMMKKSSIYFPPYRPVIVDPILTTNHAL